jgi:hypothetical protein
MGRTACTEPQCLYSRAIPLLPLWAVRPVQSLSACTRVTFTFTFIIPLLCGIFTTFSHFEIIIFARCAAKVTWIIQNAWALKAVISSLEPLLPSKAEQHV